MPYVKWRNIMEFLKKLAKKEGAPSQNPPVTLGFLGDSVTNGVFELRSFTKEDGSCGFLDCFDHNNSYPVNVRKILMSLYPHAQINIINAGISGDRAEKGLARVDRDLIPYRPDLTVVCFGLNDSTKGEAYIETYRAALLQIVKKLKAAGSEVIIMTPQPLCARVHPCVENKELRQYAGEFVEIFESGLFGRFMDAARSVAKEEDVLLCDVYGKWMAMYENGVDITELLSNYLNHPNRDMHWLFAHSLVDTMFNN